MSFLDSMEVTAVLDSRREQEMERRYLSKRREGLENIKGYLKEEIPLIPPTMVCDVASSRLQEDGKIPKFGDIVVLKNKTYGLFLWEANQFLIAKEVFCKEIFWKYYALSDILKKEDITKAFPKKGKKEFPWKEQNVFSTLQGNASLVSLTDLLPSDAFYWSSDELGFVSDEMVFQTVFKTNMYLKNHPEFMESTFQRRRTY